jgi:FkbM family methyltransferase
MAFVDPCDVSSSTKGKGPVLKGIFGLVLRILRKRSGTRGGGAVRRISYAIYRASNNPGYNFADNGELNVLQTLGAIPGSRTVLDVGANSGHWTKACIEVLGQSATVHSFEPSERIFKKLKSNIGGLENVIPYQIGLSATDCEMEIMVSDSVSEKSSVETATVLALHPHITDYRREKQHFVRGDEFCTDHGLKHVHFLKIDTEGHDLQVLSGFDGMITRGKIDIIQFEYNRMNIFTKSMLSDFYDFLNRTCTNDEYLVGRIYPQGVLFKTYSVYDENFVDGNFLAVRKTLVDLVDRLGVK